MTTSDVESLPRHKDFFFSRNRLNVAISRAENVASYAVKQAIFSPRDFISLRVEIVTGFEEE